MRLIIAALSGGLFGLGLLLSGMTDTLKVQGFLDLFGAWDPSLMFVMGGAIVPMFIAWKISAAQASPVLGGDKPSFSNTHIDRDLMIGAILFGIGWGISGFCPGPALASLSFGGMGGVTFVVSMLVGMAIWGKLRRPS